MRCGVDSPPGTEALEIARRSSMRSAISVVGVCAFLVCGSAALLSSLQAQSPKGTPLILENNEGERRLWRPIEGLKQTPNLFTLKVDPRNGGSSHLVFGTEDLPAGEQIETHRHPGSDEI